MIDTCYFIIDEIAEDNVTEENIVLRPAKYYDAGQDGLYDNIEEYLFDSSIWDFETIDSNSVEPLKLV